MGDTTQITRTDAAGVLRWKQQFEYYATGELRTTPHPEAAKGYARSIRGTSEFSYRDEDLHETRFKRDGLKRTKQVTFGYIDVSPGQSVRLGLPGGYSYEYEPGQDALSKVSSLTSTTGTPGGTYPVIAAYVHDDFGRLLSVSSPHTMTAGPNVYAYDARGNVVKRTGGGVVVTYRYDGVNRLTQLTATRNADSSTFTYSYEYDDPSARGRLRAIMEPDRTTTFTYDELGRTRFEVVAETGVATPLTTEYVYDPDGYLSEVITPSGLHVKYERDPATKDVIEVRNVDTGTKYASNVKHLPAGPITDLSFAGGATLNQGFNLRYEPLAISSGPLALSYTVNGSGLFTAVGPMSFTYDKRDRLVRATPSYTIPYTYVYPNDTPTSWLAVNDRPKEALDETGNRKYAFGYDDGSNMSAVSNYDAAGITITATTCLVHDALGRLTAVGPAKVLTGPDARACKTESDLASVTVRFRYDARNRRVGRQDGTGPWKQYVFTPDGTPLAELTKPTTSGGAWAFQREYVWLDGRPLAQIEYPGPSGGSEGWVYLVHVDHLGQPRALTSMASGVTVWSASPPRPYGDMEEATAIDPANLRYVTTNLRLPGQYDERLLSSIGLKGPFYNGQRWYLPSMARYLELDPIALRGGLNGGYAPDWYGYGNANPLRWTDPTGEEVIGAVAGAIFGTFSGASSAYTTSNGDVLATVAGGAIGFFLGGAVGAADATMGIGTMAFIGGAAGGIGNIVGDMVVGNSPSLGGTLGAIAGGALSGAFGGLLGGYAPGVGKAGAAVLGGLVGVPTEYISVVTGTALENNGTIPRRGVPWQDSGTPGDWLVAAGCK